MATYDETRQIAMEVKSNIATLKTAVDALKTSVDAINDVASLWVTNSEDASLPADTDDVRAQVEAYEALSASLSKPSISLSDSLTAE